MAFDVEKLKSYLSAQKIKELLAQFKTGNAVSLAPEAQDTSAHPFIANTKRGLMDLKATLEEGKYQLFVKQVVALLAFFLVVRFVCGKLAEKKSVLQDQIAAIAIQKDHKSEYLDNKQQLLYLEPLFPDISQKNEWMLRRLIKIFEDHRISPNMDGNVAENSGAVYTQMSQRVTFQQGYASLGRLLEDIENGADFLRISDISLVKLTGDNLGENTVNIQFNTIFPQEKYGPKLFKDYNQQIQKIQAEQQKGTIPAGGGKQ